MVVLLFLGWIFYPIAGLCAVIAIIKSITCGLTFLRKTYTDNAPNRSARRILAWNLIEPGLTIAYVLLLVGIKDEYPYDDFTLIGTALIGSALIRGQISDYLITLGLCSGSMMVLFVIVPLLAQFSADPTVRWAARKSAQLGIPRIVLTIIAHSSFGVGMLVGVPYLFWSLKKIRVWNDELLGGTSSQPAAAIVGGKEGMLVLPANQHGQSDSFKIL